MHPHDASEAVHCLDNLRRFISLARLQEVRALGEMGFDFYYNSKDSTYQVQEDAFTYQINIALELKKPVIIHTRESFQETYDVLSQYQDLQIIFHCFTGGVEWVEKFLELNHTCYFSFSGIITFRKNVEHIHKAMQAVPKDRLLIETDAPYLSPEPLRGKQNTPLNLPNILKKAAEIRNLDPSTLEYILDQNAKRIFSI